MLNGGDQDNSASVPARALRDASLLSIVVPALNEAGRLGEGAERMQRAIDAGAVDPARTELIVVDDGSADATGEVAESLYGGFSSLRIVRLAENRGKGAAVRAGVAVSRGTAVVFMDADMAVDPTQVPLLLEALSGAHVAIGSRSLPGSAVECDSVQRTMMGRAFNRLVHTATGLPFGDTQCGFKAFRAPAARLLFGVSRVDRFAFDVEILLLARRLGLRVAEVPVSWRHVRGSRIRPVADPLGMARDVMEARAAPASGPKIPGITVAAPPGATAGLVARVLEVVPSWAPVLESEAGVTAVFPLCDPDEVDPAAEAVADAVAPLAVHRVTVSVADLAAMSPLSLGPRRAPADGPGASSPAEGGPSPPGAPGGASPRDVPPAPPTTPVPRIAAGA